MSKYSSCIKIFKFLYLPYYFLTTLIRFKTYSSHSSIYLNVTECHFTKSLCNSIKLLSCFNIKYCRIYFIFYEKLIFIRIDITKNQYGFIYTIFPKINCFIKRCNRITVYEIFYSLRYSNIAMSITVCFNHCKRLSSLSCQCF